MWRGDFPARLTSTDPDLQGLTARAQPLMDVLNVEGRRSCLPLFGSVALVFLIASAKRVGPSAGETPPTAAGLRRALGARRPLGALVPPAGDREPG